MTVETRTFVELADIAGIEIECRECGSKIFYPRQNYGRKLLTKCANCNADLFLNDAGATAIEQTQAVNENCKLASRNSSRAKEQCAAANHN